jgi:hypothetical protein
MRLKTDGLIDLLKERLNAEEILNEDEIIEELTRYTARFNNSEPVEL